MSTASLRAKIVLDFEAEGRARTGSQCCPPNTIGAVIRQLRIYEIFEENKAAFHERFRDHAGRIMANYNFQFVDAWESTTDERVEFVYLLEWPDRATMVDRWAAFMNDAEWQAIKRDTNARHGPLVGEIEDRVLERVPYLRNLVGSE